MNKRLLRIIVPLFVGGAALGVVVSMMLGPSRSDSNETADAEAAPAEAVDDATEVAAEAPGDSETVDPGAADPPVEAEAAREITGPDVSLEGLHVVAVEPSAATPLGSLDDPETFEFRLEMTTRGAGIASVTFSDIWETAAARLTARAHRRAVERGDDSPPPPPDPALRYVLQEAQEFAWTDAATGEPHSITVPLLAAHSLRIEQAIVDLVTADWREVEPGAFEIEIANGEGEPVARLARRFELLGEFGISLRQSVENLTGRPLTVEWVQYGPVDLRVDRARYMDRRRFRFGYELSFDIDPQRAADVDPGKRLLVERSDVVKEENVELWPTETVIERGLRLSWFASTNRYFALVVMPPIEDGAPADRAIVDVIERIKKQVSGDTVFTGLYSPVRTVGPGSVTRFDVGVYAGPQDRHVLGSPPYSVLNLGGLILYQMSSCCAICTFQWLAELLLFFLSFLGRLDWAIAIIVLVVCVRVLLHPVTKRAQVNMQRFSKTMSGMKPELDQIQKKYREEPKRLQQEQMRLMREKGVNPAQMLGCLPMFLQTPIWVALYAMLYFAYDLRHEPAFFGIFQKIGGWPFLADLSSGDHFFGELAEPTKFLMWNITGINLLPLLMGLMFFFQQKYMTPPPSASMTEEQAKQQKMMRVMTVVLFPLMLYSAPSGLTLYILTSSTIGILEGWYIRKHITDADLEKKKPSPKKKKKKARRDAQGRAYSSAVDRAKEKRRKQQKGPEKRFKKRK